MRASVASESSPVWFAPNQNALTFPVQPCDKTALLLSFPYVCPEPVLVKYDQFLMMKKVEEKKDRFLTSTDGNHEGSILG